MAVKIINKFISFSFGTWIGAAIGLVSIPIITRFISPEDFGSAAMFALALNAMLIISSFGIDQAFVRFYYEENKEKLLSKCLIITFFVYSILSLVLYFLRVRISFYLFNAYVPELILLLAVLTAVSILNSYAVQIVRMEQKGILYSLIQVVLRLFELIFVLAFLFFLKNDYKVIVYAKAITLLAVTIIAIYATGNMWRKLRCTDLDSLYSFKEIFIYSYPLVFTMLITWAFQSFDRIAIKQWSTAYELGIYTAAYRIVLVLQMVQTSFTTYWIPLAYEKFLKNDNDEENKLFFTKANSTVSAIMLILGAGLIMSKDLVTYILGPKYKEAVSMIPFLVLIPVLLTISESTFLGIGFFKKVKITLLISIVTLVSNIIGNYFLVPVFNGIGAAMAGGISTIIFFVLRTHFALKYYYVDFKLSKFYFLFFLVFVYAIISTFLKWNMYNLILGLFLILLIAGSYYKSLKDLASKIPILNMNTTV